MAGVVEAPERIYLVVQHLGRRLRALDEELGLSPARFSALASLVFHGPLHLCELALGEGVRPPSMTRLVRDMERDGLVRRRSDLDDGRRVRVEPTARGRALVLRSRRRKIDLIRAHLAGQPRAGVRALGPALDVLEPLAEPEHG